MAVYLQHLTVLHALICRVLLVLLGSESHIDPLRELITIILYLNLLRIVLKFCSMLSELMKYVIAQSEE